MAAAKAIRGVIGQALRCVGQQLDGAGKFLELNPHVDRLQPSLRRAAFKGSKPKLGCSFIAPSATVVGNVTIGENSSVWYDAVIRGDLNSISIGDNVSVGERAMIHINGINNANPTKIGNRVVVGVGATLHGCTLEDECEIGDMATVLDNAVVKKHAKVAPGSLVKSGTVVNSRELWSGVPAKFERELTSAEISRIALKVADQMESATVHAAECAKGWQQIEEDDYLLEESRQRNDHYYKKLSKEEWIRREQEHEGHMVPGRLFTSDLSANSDPDHRGLFYDPVKGK